jgi:integrase/recombinase XerD
MGTVTQLGVQPTGPLSDADDAKLVDCWLSGLSPATARAYRADLGDLRDFLTARGVGLLGADRTDLWAWVGFLRAKGCAETTIRRRLAGASGFYSWLVRCAVLAGSPAQGLMRPRGGPAPRLGPGRKELCRLLRVARAQGRREELLVRLLCVCGLRVSEAVGLDASDIVSYEGRVLLSLRRKGGRRELVGVPKETATLLFAHLGDQGAGPVLRSRGGKRLSTRGARWIIGRLGEESGLAALHPHLLRHGFVTQALAAGVALPVVAAGAGHQDIRVTIGYAQALAAAGAEAAEAVEERLGG